jgi:hypothetical protein
MPSEGDNSELEARLRELAPMVEAVQATEGQLPPEKQAQLLERIADNALERRLKELAPMVEAVQATEGQLPPEKMELLLKRIAKGTAKRRLQARDEERGKYRCPWCWWEFDIFASVATHPSLKGDPLLGQNEFLRFIANRFNAAGKALDAMGSVCDELACPNCHDKLPRSFTT